MNIFPLSNLWFISFVTIFYPLICRFNSAVRKKKFRSWFGEAKGTNAIFHILVSFVLYTYIKILYYFVISINMIDLLLQYECCVPLVSFVCSNSFHVNSPDNVPITYEYIVIYMHIDIYMNYYCYIIIYKEIMKYIFRKCINK